MRSFFHWSSNGYVLIYTFVFFWNGYIFIWVLFWFFKKKQKNRCQRMWIWVFKQDDKKSWKIGFWIDKENKCQQKLKQFQKIDYKRIAKLLLFEPK